MSEIRKLNCCVQSITADSPVPVPVIKVPRSNRLASGDVGVDGVRNLALFEHKRTLFNMDNTIISLTLGGSCYSRGGLKPDQGAPSLYALSTTISNTHLSVFLAIQYTGRTCLLHFERIIHGLLLSLLQSSAVTSRCYWSNYGFHKLSRC